MKGAYRSIPELDELLAPERDPITGRLTAARQDKGRRPSRRQRSSKVVTVAVIAAIVLIGSTVAVAVTASRSDDAAELGSGGESQRGEGSTTITGATSTTAGARAIQLAFAGGEYTEKRCFVAIPGTPCNTDGMDLDLPIQMRCVRDEGCTIPLPDGSNAEVGTGPIRATQTLPRESEPACPGTTFTWNIVPEGSDETRGIDHPARLTGTLALFADAQNLNGSDCWGLAATYELDATPV